MTQPADLARFEHLGRTAYRTDQPAAPALNADIQTAIADMPVGTGAATIMKAFTRGYEAERAVELARLGF